MNDRIRELLADIHRLEDELAEEMQNQQSELLYWFEGRKVRFEQSIRQAQRRVRIGVLRWLAGSRPQDVLSAPVIYSLIVPLLLLDGFVSVYQAICFRVYGIPRVSRDRYIALDRHQLDYLNPVEKLNCVYCGYANGLLAYVREIASRTEQYWCPLKHARKVLDPHRRYAQFADFGDFAGYHARQAELRRALAHEQEAPDDSA